MLMVYILNKLGYIDGKCGSIYGIHTDPMGNKPGYFSQLRQANGPARRKPLLITSALLLILSATLAMLMGALAIRGTFTRGKTMGKHRRSKFLLGTTGSDDDFDLS